MVDAGARILRHMRGVYAPTSPLTSCKTKTHIGLRVYYSRIHKSTCCYILFPGSYYIQS